MWITQVEAHTIPLRIPVLDGEAIGAVDDHSRGLNIDADTEVTR